MLLAIVLAQMIVPPPALPRGCRDRSCVRQRAVIPHVPLFEFAPLNGAGMGTACACATPTGSQGEAMTFTRASSGTCLKSASSFVGIANGDMVTCSTNQPRIEPMGIALPLGALIELARTNQALWSEVLDSDSGVWVPENSGVPGNPTVTANFGVAPDGTQTAERIQFPATDGGTQYAGIYQLSAMLTASSPMVCSGWFRATNGTPDGGVDGGTLDLCMINNDAGIPCNQPCSFVSDSWTRCYDLATTSGPGTLEFGNMTKFNGGISRPAADVLAWGFDCESTTTGPRWPSSYIKTTSASVARATETLSVPITISPGARSYASTVNTPYTNGTSISPNLFRVAITLADAGVDRDSISGLTDAPPTWRVNYVSNAVSHAQNAPTSLTPNVNQRVSANYTGAFMGFCQDGACTQDAGTFTPPTGSGTLFLGSSSAGASPIHGHIAQFCYDPTATGCQ